MNSMIIREKKKNLKLNEAQRQIIIGLLLGDGHLETLNNGRTYRLKVEYSSKQKEYLYWLWKYFKEWTGSPPKDKEKILPSGTIVRSIYFTTYIHGAFRFYGHQFYSQEKKKTIPKNIHKLITPLSLAIWFMDDGSWKSNKHRTYIIHTDGYCKKDLINIQNALKTRFGIEVLLHRQYKNWRIYVKTSSAKKFREIIEKYILPSMRYKLGNICLKSNGGVY